MHAKHAGFTLLELLVVIAIAGVLTGIAIPSFRSAIQSAQTREAATSFYSALTRARSEAIARNTTVSVCARDFTDPATKACKTSAAWQDGWLVYKGTVADTIQLHEPIADGLQLTTSATTPLDFDASGRVAALTTYDLCPRAPDVRGRRITVARSGRVALEPHTCGA